MPNTPAAVGQGMTLLCADGASEEEIAGLQAMLARSGAFSRVPENLVDAAGCVTGCAPAFTCLFVEGLADGAVAAGVPRAQALEFAARTVLGTAALLLETNQHPGQLKDAVCSPGGTTIAGVQALEDRGFRRRLHAGRAGGPWSGRAPCARASERFARPPHARAGVERVVARADPGHDAIAQIPGNGLLLRPPRRTASGG